MPMRHKALIHLITFVVTSDAIGNQIREPMERRVFANEMSVGMKEFYEAGNGGLRPERQFEMYAFEYQGEPQLRHDGITYRIIRTSGAGDKLRLVCERVVGNEN